MASTATGGDAVTLELSILEGRGGDCEVHAETITANVHCGFATFDIAHDCGDENVFHKEGGEYIFKLSEGATVIAQHYVKLNTSNG